MAVLVMDWFTIKSFLVKAIEDNVTERKRGGRVGKEGTIAAFPGIQYPC